MKHKLAIEIPIYNRNDNLYNYLLPTIQNIQQLSKYADIVINFNGDFMADENIQAEVIEEFEKIGFEVYHSYHKYNLIPGKGNILQIREDTHESSPYFNEYEYILRLDDDMELLEGYAKDVLAGILYMEKNPNVGIISLQNYSEEKCIIKPYSVCKVIYQMGGILLKNIKEWNGLVPQKYRHLYGCTEDAFNCFVRFEIGLESRILQTNHYQHYEHRVEIKKGFVYFNWGGSSRKDKNSILGFLASTGAMNPKSAKHNFQESWYLKKYPAYWKTREKDFRYGDIPFEDLEKEYIKFL